MTHIANTVSYQPSLNLHSTALFTAPLHWLRFRQYPILFTVSRLGLEKVSERRLPSVTRLVKTAGPRDAELTQSSDSRRQRWALPLPCASRPLVSLPAAKRHHFSNTRMNSHHTEHVLSDVEMLFPSLCAPCCLFSAVFVSPQCNAHLPLYCKKQEVSQVSGQHLYQCKFACCYLISIQIVFLDPEFLYNSPILIICHSQLLLPIFVTTSTHTKRNFVGSCLCLFILYPSFILKVVKTFLPGDQSQYEII